MVDFFGETRKLFHISSVNNVALLDLCDVDCFLKDDEFDVSACLYCVHYSHGHCDCEDEWLVD